MRKTTLKPDKSGQFYRNLGRKRTRTGRVSQHKFLLGANRKEAEKRNERLELLWRIIQQREGEAATWSNFTLEIGRAIAMGKSEVVVARRRVQSHIPGVEQCYQDDASYALALTRLSNDYPLIAFVPESVEAFNRGVEKQGELAVANLDRLEKEASKYRQVLQDAGKPVPGEMLHDAFYQYIEWIKKEYFQESEGHISDTGMTKIRQVKTILQHIENVPISSLLDYEAADAVYRYFRKRPKSVRTGQPMKRKSCKNYIGELGRFFEWLHLSQEYAWRKPEDFERIKKKVEDLEEDAHEESKLVPVFTIDELCLLNEYARPVERVFFLLGINCAYGADQAGRLRVGEVHLADDGDSFIRRIRRKQKVRGEHLLFSQTAEAMRWALNRRNRQKPARTLSSDECVLLNDNGNPYWRKTKGGNRCRDIPNTFNRLIDRIQKDHPDFPRHGFNTLRDTSSHMIREIAGAEVASIHLTHKHQYSDPNLRRYTNPPLAKLFDAQRELERRLQRMFDAAPTDPFTPQRKAYTSHRIVKRIRKLHEEGRPVSQIAAKVKLARTTVYRHLEQ